MEVLGKRLTVNEQSPTVASTATALSRDETMLVPTEVAGCCRHQRPSTGRLTFGECAPNLGDLDRSLW